MTPQLIAQLIEVEKPTAPALAKGLWILQLLNQEGPLRLERLSEITHEPKASILRYLNTLIQLHFVTRDPQTKLFSAAINLVPLKNMTSTWDELVYSALASLSDEFSLTTEWYIPHAHGLIVAKQVTPEASQVSVRAKVGFIRPLNDELEAVTRCGLIHQELPPTQFWQWGEQDRVYGQHPVQNPLKAMDYLYKNGVTMDTSYNCNGFRRYAAPVLYPDHSLKGVLSLVEHFRPNNDAHCREKLFELKQKALELQLALQTHNPNTGSAQ